MCFYNPKKHKVLFFDKQRNQIAQLENGNLVLQNTIGESVFKVKKNIYKMHLEVYGDVQQWLLFQNVEHAGYKYSLFKEQFSICRESQLESFLQLNAKQIKELNQQIIEAILNEYNLQNSKALPYPHLKKYVNLKNKLENVRTLQNLSPNEIEEKEKTISSKITNLINCFGRKESNEVLYNQQHILK